MYGNDAADVSPDCYTNCSQEHTKNVLSLSKIKSQNLHSTLTSIRFSMLQYCTSMLLNDSKTELNLSLKFPI